MTTIATQTHAAEMTLPLMTAAAARTTFP